MLRSWPQAPDKMHCVGKLPSLWFLRSDRGCEGSDKWGEKAEQDAVQCHEFSFEVENCNLQVCSENVKLTIYIFYILS